MSGFALTLLPRHVQIDMDFGALTAATFVRACFMLRAPRFAALHFPTYATLNALDFPGAQDARRITGLDIDGLLTSTSTTPGRSDHWSISFSHLRPPARNFDVHGSMAILLTTGGPRQCVEGAGAGQVPSHVPVGLGERLAGAPHGRRRPACGAGQPPGGGVRPLRAGAEAVQLPAADPDLADEPLAVGVQPHP